jgi:ubiquinol-cytochrome c reductase cytochrome c1 subunit
MRALQALTVALGVALAAPALAATDTAAPPARNWSFDGVFGTFDRAALQRGFQVYKDVCSACHSMNLVAYRNLGDPGGPGFNEAEVKAIAASVEVTDPRPNDQGEMVQRPGLPSDKFKAPFPNEQAAKAANNGALPPDLSLIAKARAGGADYLHGLLTGYADPPADFKLTQGLNYNKYFPGHQIAMAPPLAADAVSYTDGTQATVDQMASDVAQFLMWAAEPKLEERKRIGFQAILFLIVATGLFYAVKRKVWADVH